MKSEPQYELVKDNSNEATAVAVENVAMEAQISVQTISISCDGVADYVRYHLENFPKTFEFPDTFIYQKNQIKFDICNDSQLALPIHWNIENMMINGMISQSMLSESMNVKRPTTAGGTVMVMKSSPFTIYPLESVIGPGLSENYTITFAPSDVMEYDYRLVGQSSSLESFDFEDNSYLSEEKTEQSASSLPSLTASLKGLSLRPLCHIEVNESTTYLATRSSDLKNEYGLFSPIETPNIRVVEVESIGIRTKNTISFDIVNPTGDDYECVWRSVGEACASWRCLSQITTYLSAGKRVEVIFEFAPDSNELSEAFYKFRIPSNGYEQLFLLVGKVKAKSLISFSEIRLPSLYVDETKY